MFLRKGEYEAAPVNVMQRRGFSFQAASAADTRTASTSNRWKATLHGAAYSVAATDHPVGVERTEINNRAF